MKSKKRRKSVSFNTLTSVAGVSLGVMALLVVLSVMSGFHEDLQKKILGANAHVVIQSHSNGIPNYSDVMEKIRDIDGVKAVSPLLMGQVMLSRNKRAHGVFLRGIDTEYEKKTTEKLAEKKKISKEDKTTDKDKAKKTKDKDEIKPKPKTVKKVVDEKKDDK